jgi:hypothetical protein
MAALLATASPALAGPVEGNVGILYKPLNSEFYGLEGELRLTGSPWSLGGLYLAERQISASGPTVPDTWVSPSSATAWGRWRYALANGDDVSALVGINSHSGSPYHPPVPEGWTTGPLVGASYTMRSGRLWLRVTPHWVFSANGGSSDAEWLIKSGLAWVEAGVRPFPHLEVSARLAMAFLKVAYTFD